MVKRSKLANTSRLLLQIFHEKDRRKTGACFQDCCIPFHHPLGCRHKLDITWIMLTSPTSNYFKPKEHHIQVEKWQGKHNLSPFHLIIFFLKITSPNCFSTHRGKDVSAHILSFAGTKATGFYKEEKWVNISSPRLFYLSSQVPEATFN